MVIGEKKEKGCDGWARTRISLVDELHQSEHMSASLREYGGTR
jgi:hypothetical protein